MPDTYMTSLAARFHPAIYKSMLTPYIRVCVVYYLVTVDLVNLPCLKFANLALLRYSLYNCHKKGLYMHLISADHS